MLSLVIEMLNPTVHNPQGGKVILDRLMRTKPNRGRKYGPEYAEKHKRWYEMHKGGLSYADIEKIVGMDRSTVRWGIKAHEKRLAKELEAQ